MNLLMLAFASLPGDEIFTMLPELPMQHFPGLTFFLRRLAHQQKIEKDIY